MSALPAPARSGAAVCADAGAAAPATSSMAASAVAKRLTGRERSAPGARLRRLRLQDLHVGVVAHHEAIRLRQRRPPPDAHVLADQARLDAELEVRDRGAGHHDRVLELRL